MRSRRVLWAAYGAVIAGSALVVAVAALWAFEGAYNEKLNDLNLLTVQNLDRELRAEVWDRVRGAAIAVSTDLVSNSDSFFGVADSADANAVKLRLTYQALNVLRDSQNTVLRAIRVFYPHADLVVATDQGLVLDASRRSSFGRWARRLQDSGQPELWVREDDRLTFVQAFPAGGPSGPEALVAIETDLPLVRQILGRFGEVDGGGAFLADSQGERIDAGAPPGTVLPAVPGTTTQVSNGVRFLVTGLSTENGPGTLVAYAPLARLSESGNAFRWLLGLTALAVVAAGTAVAALLARHLERPVARLLRLVRLHRKEAPEKDDFALWESVLEENRDLVRNDVVGKLFEASFEDDAEAAASVRMIGWQTLRGPFRVLFLSWSSARLDGHPTRGPAIPYRFRQEWEALPGVLAARPLGQNSLGVVVEGGGELWIEQFQGWEDRVREQIRLRVRVAEGPLVTDLPGLAASFDQARARSADHFFFPARKILRFRTGSHPGPLKPPAVHEALASRAPGAFRLLMEPWLKEFQEREGSAAEGWRLLGRISDQVAAWARELDPPGSVQRSLRMAAIDQEADGIDAWVAMLSAEVDRVLAIWSDRSAERQTDVIVRVKEYLVGHLARDLSLETVALEVGLSAGYLSQLFREISGTTFVTYLTELRLKEAERLLVTTPKTVQEVGFQVGFRTPAYFIRLYKTRFGLTPNEYRRSRKSETGSVLMRNPSGLP